ncbi:MAG: nucleotidyltransferase family protein [Ignavibacteriota bacterium]|nr:nucleotidyltransferase family protein [Ignavibacteriales bacterium]MBV6421428.1 Molybdenum cofactor cytidylyltransferase [Ignavibacteriaceae bacterium]QKJ96815.1 MAG: nucleotidyltransferase family protein [Ignavibacteriota bacterium]MCC7094869.1 nucleotidyltransferase family protein [Ignavibacteriaceae bacterium]MCL4278679.1 nucleotidyltransferase family protein [Ignavibacteriaceae bacterium]
MNKKENYSSVLLAAGTSSRMKQWKPGILLNNKPLLFYSLKTLSEVCNEVIIVGGYNFEKLLRLTDEFSNKYNFPLICVENKNYLSGMFSSVKKGIENVTADNIFIALSDIPFVKSETYIKMIDCFETTETKPDIIYPSFSGNESGIKKRGHPVLITKRIKQRIINETGDVILSHLLHEFKGIDCAVNDKGINFDIDTETDFENAQKYFSD